MSKFKLSFCMPTRNRAGFIGEALDSIISQANENIEIVIVDGASFDNTTQVVQEYQKKFKNIVYLRLEKNGGVDRDMAKAIELAQGEYCWLFADDDALKPGAINRILNEIGSKDEIYLCNITVCDHEMRPLRSRYWLSKEVNDRVFALHVKDQFIEYCNWANSIGALFSYWSSIVLRREEWNTTGFKEEFAGTAYASAGMLLSFIKRKCRLKYIKDQLVLWRSDNISFQNEGGLVKRFLLDLDGYLKLADAYFSIDLDLKNAFLRVMTREHPWYTIINVTSFIDRPEVWKSFREKMLKFGYSPALVAVCYALGRNRQLISAAVAVKRKILGSLWISKIAGLFCRK